MFKRDSSGVITVFVSLMLIPLLTFGTVVMEAGRYLSARSLLAEAQTMAAMTVLANYNVYLNERFGLLAVEPDGTGKTSSEIYGDSLLYNSDSISGVSKASQLYTFNSKSDWSFKTVYELSDFNVLKRQILEYSKYSVPYEYLSEKLGLEGVFGDFFKKFEFSGIENFLNEMSADSKASTDAIDNAFKALGKVEYYNIDLKNFLGESNDSSAYKDDSLYKNYIKDNDDLEGLSKPQSYGDSNNYNKRYKAYIDQIIAKSNYIDTNANPHPKKAAADTALTGITVLGKTTNRDFSIYSVSKFLLEYRNSEEFSIPSSKSYLVSYTTYTASISGNNTYSLSYTGSPNSVSYSTDSASYGYYVTTAIREIKKALNQSNRTIESYDDLESLLSDYLDECDLNNSVSTDSALQNRANEAAQRIKDYYNKYNKHSAVSSLANSLGTECTNYDNAINGYNTAISNAKQGYIDALNSVQDKFSSYISALESAATNLKTASGTYSDAYADEAEAQENVSNTIGIMDKLVKELETEKTNAESIKGTLETIESNVSNTDINGMENYSSSESKDYINGTLIGITQGKIKGYVGMSGFTNIVALCDSKPMGDTTDNNFSIKNVAEMAADAFGITEIWESFKAIGEFIKNGKETIGDVGELINPIPATSNKDFDMKLDDASVNALPIYNTDGTSNKADKDYAETLMESAKQQLGGLYQITSVSFGTGQEYNEFIDAINKMQASLDTLFNDAFNFRDCGWADLIPKLKKIITAIADLFSALGSLIGSLFDMLMNLLEQAYGAILLNTYVTQKFPSRMSDNENATVVPVDGACDPGAYYFNSCCVEYVFAGKNDESSNQSAVFWMIFGIRAVINVVQLFLSKDTMSLVSACNVFAPLMFIALLYMETNIDMNYLVRAGQAVPIWKGSVHMSAAGIKNLLKNLIDVDNVIPVYYTNTAAGKRYHKSTSCRTLQRSLKNGTVEQTTISGAMSKGLTGCAVCCPIDTSSDGKDFVKVTYDKYVYVLLYFVGGEKKLQRIGNLIQLETRYYESQNKGAANFLLSKAGTYVRTSAKARYNTLLPMFSLGGNTGGFPSVYSLKYTGY